MPTNRLEAFSDGVIAIIITIMVLELHAPHDADPRAFMPMLPALIGYVLSFVFVGIYWNNHHHLFQAAKRVTGMTLWANLHLLFWLSLIPMVTSWMGQTHFAKQAVAGYGVVLLLCALAYTLLSTVLLSHHDNQPVLGTALRHPTKEWTSLALYAAGIGMAFVSTWIACALYVAVAVIWFIPDIRIEREIEKADESRDCADS